MDNVVETPFEITFTEEQALLKESAAAFAAEKSPSKRVRELVDSPLGFDEDAWREMANLGWTGLATPERHGGTGLDIAGATPIIEALGTRLMASPLMSSLLASYALTISGNEALQAKWLPVLAGGAIGSLALADSTGGWEWHAPTCRATRKGDKLMLSGEKRFVPYGAAANVVIASVSLDGEALLVAIPGDALRETVPEISVDATQRLCVINLNDVEIGAADVLSDTDVSAVVLAGTLLQAAEMCGGIAGALEVTLEYLKTRKQFGRLIGTFQALKHTMSDAWVQYELLRSLVYAGASNLHSKSAELLVRMAKAKASELFVHVGDRAVQFHGGFGFTYDCDAGFYLRRAIWGASQFGNAMHHRKRLAAILLDDKSAAA